MTGTDTTTADAPPPPGHADRVIDALIGLTMLGMCFVGFVLADVAALTGRTYWMICVALFAVASFWLFWRHRDAGMHVWRLLFRLSIHWLGALVAVYVVFGFIDAGRIANNSAGLMASVVLGLATYLAGVHGSWRLLAIGAAIGLGTVAAAFLEQFIWVLFGLALAAIALLAGGDRLLGRRHDEAA